MPDPEGNITAGTDTVEAPGNTPVLSQPMPPDIITGTLPASVPPAAPAVGGPVAPNLPQPARPTQQPSFFRRVLLSLGQGLIEGTKAGLQAPLTAQGPAIAAQTAINAPEVARERLTAAQMDKVRLEMSTINLAMARYALTHVDDDRAQAYYKAGQKYANDLIEKGNANLIATGTADDIHKLLAQKKGENPDQNLMAFPNPGASGHDQEDGYMLLEVAPKERLSEDVAERTIPAHSVTTADGTTINYPEIKIPGAKKGTPLATFNAITTSALKLFTLRDADIGRSAGIASREMIAGRQISSRERIAQWRNITSLAVAEKNNITRRGTALMQSQDKELIAAGKGVLDAQKKLADLTGKVSTVKEFFGLEEPRKDAIAEAAEALKDARANAERLVKQKTGGGGPRPIPKALLGKYLKDAGNNVEAAKALARKDNYDPDNVQ